MLATCEKRPMTAMSNMAYYRRLTIVLALFCALPIATLAQTADTPQNPPPPLGQLVDVGGYRVHLYCTGTGRPSVVIVGAGYSFDWGLVQSEVAKFTQVCAYDHSGIAWSDGGPKDSCSLRVAEVHAALKSAGIKGPYVLVGHSLGALVARTYAGRYLDEVAGIVFVDHAFSLIRLSLRTDKAPPPMPPQMPSTPGGRGPVIFGMESDPNFSKLSSRDRELHLWWTAQTRDQTALQSNHEMTPECVAEADTITKEHSQPLGDRPLVDVSTDNGAPEYAELQTKLLSLSRNSKQIVAEKSGHFVIIDRPDAVTDAIRSVVQSVRDKAKL